MGGLKRLYHKIMIWWWGWRIKRLIAKMRRVGKQHGLPPLDEWTDEQIVMGLKTWYKAEHRDCGGCGGLGYWYDEDTGVFVTCGCKVLPPKNS